MRSPKPETRSSKLRRQAGFTLIEILIAISITAVLALAVAVAIGASLTAYTTTSEMASMQTSSRLVMQKTMTMIRNASLHDAYDPADGTVTLLQPTDADHPLQTVGVQMQLSDGNLVKIWWAVNDDYADSDLGDLWYQQNTSTSQTLIERVRCLRANGGDPYVFTLASRTSDTGLLLARATLDLTVERDAATTTSMEQARAGVGAMRVVSSTMPRKNTD
jgi:prepilin-type N-terminal cleavage/methylation domain-containing protein